MAPLRSVEEASKDLKADGGCDGRDPVIDTDLNDIDCSWNAWRQSDGIECDVPMLNEGSLSKFRISNLKLCVSDTGMGPVIKGMLARLSLVRDVREPKNDGMEPVMLTPTIEILVSAGFPAKKAGKGCAT